LLSVSAVVDVVGHLPVAEYNQFIRNAVNFQGYPYQDWGNEPSLAVNPLNPNQMAIATFAYGHYVQPGTNASLWCSTDGGADWGIRFPITQQPVPGQFVPNDQVIAYDSSGVLHGTFLTGSPTKNQGLNLFFGSTADPSADGVNGRPASMWQWNPNPVNIYPQSASSADRPWLALGDGHAYVGYAFYGDNSNRGAGNVEVRVSASADNGATFATDHNINSTNDNGSLSVASNPGVVVATDQLGNVYSLYQWGESPYPKPGDATRIHYRLNMSSDGGQTWKFTSLGGQAGGLDVDDGLSLQAGALFGGANNTLSITALAADPTGQHIYPVYGKEDANGVDRVWLAEFHPDGQGGLVEGANPVALSVPGQRSALASVAVTANGTVFVLYDSFDGTEFHVHLAKSTNFGQTFADQDLYDFTATGILFKYNGDNRILGDYQFLTAVGNSVYGTFAGRGNVVDPSTGIDTTGYMDPFFFTANAPTNGQPSPGALGAAGGAQLPLAGAPGQATADLTSAALLIASPGPTPIVATGSATADASGAPAASAASLVNEVPPTGGTGAGLPELSTPDGGGQRLSPFARRGQGSFAGDLASLGDGQDVTLTALDQLFASL
jgi:hypothetical protein